MYHQVIDFWFSEVNKNKRFAKDEAFDQEIRSTFSGLHKQAVNCELWAWRSSPLGSLAEIILLDQFSRNMYRGKPESFMNDSFALALSKFAIANGFDADLLVEQRNFLYMPFMHSESLSDHETAVNLFTELGVESSLRYELRHKAIIEQFGRYPHRNKILGRRSTPEEEAFLLTPGSGF